MAASGTINEKILTTLNDLPYYTLKYPKSLDNAFGDDIVFPLLTQKDGSIEDMLATYTEHIAMQIAAEVEKHLPDIAHIQFADNPGRHEPGTGEINFSNVFRRLDEIGYSGYVSAEYLPKSQTVAGLGWLQTFN